MNNTANIQDFTEFTVNLEPGIYRIVSDDSHPIKGLPKGFYWGNLIVFSALYNIYKTFLLFSTTSASFYFRIVTPSADLSAYPWYEVTGTPAELQ